MDKPAIVKRPVIFTRGENVKWKGVVMIERPRFADSKSMCKVRSARTIEFNGFRAVVVELPYSAVKKYFRAGDGLETWAYAEVYDAVPFAHMELYERACRDEFFETASGGLPAVPS